MIKRLFWLVAAFLTLAVTSCEKGVTEMEEAPDFTILPSSETLSGTDLETRTYRGTGYKVLWTANDLVSVFLKHTANRKYMFQGQTGDNGGMLSPAEDGIYTGSQLSCNYSVYPYAAGTRISEEGVVSYTLPDTQTYAENSFGLGANVMCAATANVEDTDLLYFNALGYFEINIYGSASVKKIVFTAGGDKPLSGPAEIIIPYHAGPTLTMKEGGSPSVTLDCGDGVALGATVDAATKFVIMVPPTNFTSGFSLEITDTEGKVMTKSTANSFNITRNNGISMEAFEMVGTAPDPGTNPDPGTDPNPDDPDPEPQIPDLPDLLYDSGLPVLYVFTPDATPVDQKVTWISGSHAYLKDVDGTVTDLGEANIRGRGNTTWNYIKKPYAFKLEKKASLLGMPADKRWDLLANYLDRTRLRNDLAFELGRRLVDKGVIQNWWTPKGKYVELVINDTHFGNYYLCEHIKIAKNRINITEMKPTDIDEETITGGYLLECGIEMDEGVGHQFWTSYFTDTYPYNRHGKSGNNYHIPVMIKDPEEITTEQFNWIESKINSIQGHIVNNNSTWLNEVDIDSFICWMFVQECVGNYEPFHPKSSYMHKDRGGKLVMGPLWDFDYGTFKNDYGMTPIYHYSMWYPYMLNNATFKARVKELWPSIKATFREVCNEYATNFSEATATPETSALAVSIDRDWVRWKNMGGQPTVNGDEETGIWAAFKRLTDNLSRRINQMNGEDGLFGD